MWSQYQNQINNYSKFVPMTEIPQIKRDLSQIYKTPIKQVIGPNVNNNSSPYQFDLNLYFGNIFSSGHLPVQRLLSSAQPNRESSSFFINKTSFDKSLFKNSSDSSLNNNNLNININNNNSCNNNNNFDKEKIILKFNDNINNNIFKNNNVNNNNKNEFTKRNLFEIFNNIGMNDEGQQFFVDNNNNNKNLKENNNKFINISNNINNINNNNNKNYTYTPKKNSKPKKIFECSASTLATDKTISNKKKRRFRKNIDQIKLLSVFYKENKHWNKNQIKKISEKIGLKENKVYKWLWDQRNKEMKNAKFVITNNNNNISINKNNDNK